MNINKHEGWSAYSRQKLNAKRREIPFLLSFEEWWAWWQIDNRWAKRGRTKDSLVMARIGDTGPYALGNIYCCTQGHNLIHVDIDKISKGQEASWRRRKARGDHGHLAVRGDGHPRSKPVMTPAGRFGSAALAAEHFKVTRATVGNRIKAGLDGWSFAP